MLMNYVKYKGYELPARTTTAFNDETSIASWAYDAVKRIQAAGIVSGRPGNLYDPQATATRAEVATIFARFVETYVSHALALDTGNANQNPSTGGAQTTATGMMDVYFDRRAMEAIKRALMAKEDDNGEVL